MFTDRVLDDAVCQINRRWMCHTTRLRHNDAESKKREDKDASRIFTKKEAMRGENGIITDRLLQVWKSHVRLLYITIYPHTISDSDYPGATSSLFAKTGDHNRIQTCSYNTNDVLCRSSSSKTVNTRGFYKDYYKTFHIEHCNTCQCILHDTCEFGKVSKVSWTYWLRSTGKISENVTWMRKIKSYLFLCN